MTTVDTTKVRGPIVSSLGLSALALLFAIALRTPPETNGPILNGAFLLLHGALAWRTRDARFRRGFTCATLSIAPVGALLGMLHTPHAVWFLLFAAQLYTALYGTLQRGERTGRQAAQLALATLLFLPLAQTLLVAFPRGLFLEATVPTRTERERDRPRNQADVESALRRLVDSGVGFGSSLERLQDDVVLEVSGRSPKDRARLKELGTLYFRGSWLDTITADRTHQSRPPEAVNTTWRDEVDGAVDGWTRVSPGNLRHIALRVRQQSLAWGEGKTLVLAPIFAQAVQLPSLEERAGGILVTEDTTGDWLDYQAWIADPVAFAASTPVPAEEVESRFLQLPDSPVVGRLRSRALEINAGANSDAERIASVIDWFQGSFSYDLAERGTPGLESVEVFLDRRRGYCTYFAVSAVLLLRTVGVPARVATGFLVEAELETGGASRNESLWATTRSAHAWVEVPFQENGRTYWRAFDPTPAAARRRALSLDVQASDLEETLQGIAQGFAAWAQGGEASSAQTLFSELLHLPSTFLAHAKTRPRTVLIVAFLLLCIVAIRRRARRPKARVAYTGDAESDALASRLIGALRERGVLRTPGMTLREVVRAFDRPQKDDRPRLGPHVERLYRARFGGQPLGKEERDELLRALEALE